MLAYSVSLFGKGIPHLHPSFPSLRILPVLSKTIQLVSASFAATSSSGLSTPILYYLGPQFVRHTADLSCL